MEQVIRPAAVEGQRDGPDGIGTPAEGLDLIAHPSEYVLILQVHGFFPPGQGDHHGRHDHLGRRLLLAVIVKIAHQPLIVDLFMGGVLVDHHQLFFILDQPVGLKDLADDAEAGHILL